MMKNTNITGTKTSINTAAKALKKAQSYATGNAAGTSPGWQTLINSSPIYSVSKSNYITGVEKLQDMFILMMKDLDENSIENILNVIKEKQPENYYHCLVNLIAYPNFRLMSDQFMINRYEDIKKAMEETHKHIDFVLTYGNLLDTMSGFKLLLLL
jgi:hypothetical protein